MVFAVEENRPGDAPRRRYKLPFGVDHRAWPKKTSFLARLHRVHYGLLGLRFRGAGDRAFCTSTGEHAGDSRICLSHTLPPIRVLQLATPIRHLCNAGDSGLLDTGGCGLYGTDGWQPAWLPLFRRAGWVYVALNRDATDRAIGFARTFGTRGRVLVPPEDLGPKGDLNDWLRMGAKGDPAAFRSLLEGALATSQTPWALQVERLPSDLAPWDLEDHAGVRDLLCELGHQIL